MPPQDPLNQQPNQGQPEQPVPPQQPVPPAVDAANPYQAAPNPVQPGQPAYPPQPGAAPNGYAQPEQSTPGIAIAGLIMAFIIPLVGLILSIVALGKTKGRNGHGLALAGVIVSAVFMFISIPIFLLLILSTTNGIQHQAKDTESKTDIATLDSQVEGVYALSGIYPSLANLNDASWRQTNMSTLDSAALTPPGGSSEQLTDGKASTTSYSYVTTPADCTGTSASPCKSFTLSALLSTGEEYSLKSLNY